jgi:hypothetical protein
MNAPERTWSARWKTKAKELRALLPVGEYSAWWDLKRRYVRKCEQVAALEQERIRLVSKRYVEVERLRTAIQDVKTNMRSCVPGVSVIPLHDLMREWIAIFDRALDEGEK